MIIKIYRKINNKWYLSETLYSDIFIVREYSYNDGCKTVHYSHGFCEAEKVKIYPIFKVAKVWEKSRIS